MKPSTLKTIVSQLVLSIDETTHTKLTEIVFEGEHVYIRTNHASLTPTETANTGGRLSIDKWLASHDPDTH